MRTMQFIAVGIIAIALATETVVKMVKEMKNEAR